MSSPKNRTVGWEQESVIFDIDGVLADFVHGFTRLAREMYGGQVRVVSTADQEFYGDNGGLSPQQVAETWKAIMQSEDFWLLLPAEDGAWSAIRRVSLLAARGIPVYFVTNRVGLDPIRQTQRWLFSHHTYELNMPQFRPNVILTKNKGDVARAVNAKFCIEDKAENAWCVAWLSKGTKSYLLDRQYNRTSFGASSVIRVASVSDYLDTVEAYFND